MGHRMGAGTIGVIAAAALVVTFTNSTIVALPSSAADYDYLGFELPGTVSTMFGGLLTEGLQMRPQA